MRAILFGDGRLGYLQDLDARRAELRFQLPAHVEAAHVRQVDVEHRQIGPLCPCGRERFPARPCLGDQIVGAPQNLRLDEPGRLVVIQYQNVR